MTGALRRQGKTRFLGLTAIGDTTALHRVVDARAFDSAQVVYNMLNPSAASELPPNYPAQDYGRLFGRASAAGVGVVGIRACWLAARCPGRLRGTCTSACGASTAPDPWPEPLGAPAKALCTGSGRRLSP
jgi:hypothetical protein